MMIGRILRCLLVGGIAVCLEPLAVTQPHTASDYRNTVLAIQDSIEKGDIGEARRMVDRALASYPSDGGLENLRGIVEIQQGDTEGARRDFRGAIRHSPRLTSAYLNLARIELGVGDQPSRERALVLYRQVLTYDPANAEANYQVAILLMRQRHFERSLDQLARLGADAQALAGPLLVRCADEVGMERLEQAKVACAKAAQDPNLVEEDIAIVGTMLEAPNQASLLETLLTAIQRSRPLSVGGLRTLGRAQEAQGKLPQARATLEKAFSSDNASVDALVDLARVANEQEQYKDSLGYLAHARVLRPQDGSLAYSFALVCLKLNLIGEAHKALQNALDLVPDNPDYILAMGKISMYLQDPLVALPYLTKYRTLRPHDASTELALGTVYYRAKDFAEAVPWLRQAVNDPPSAAEAHYYLGSILRKQGNYDEALAEFTQSLRLKPDQAETEGALGQLQVQRKQYDQAQVLFEHALALDPDSYAANFGLLQLYAHNGDPRREEQSRRFEAIKARQEQQSQEAMRIIDARPETETPIPH